LVKKSGRRNFLKMMGSGTIAATLPMSISRALAIPANDRTGTLEDVEHIVILTQENRSFDHYFGTLKGVRGFSDPRAVKLPSGKAVWHQPNGSGELLPFRPNVANLGATFLPDPPHGWNDTHAAWNGGKHDQWVPNKGVTTMTYHTRKDLPYHYALADAFTICDAYHCSVMGPTDPNRYHLWTGWLGNDGAGGGPVITNAEVGYDWSSFPERLEHAGISWKIYQDAGVGLDAAGYWGWTSDPYIGNYGDNALLYLHQYQNALQGTPLADKAKTGTNIQATNNRQNPIKLLDIFRDDVRHNRLPQVSWIAAPEAYSEHPNWPANYGAWYMSQFIDILVSNPELFSKTALFINYDEEGGFFDHQVPPTPPQSRVHGLSTVATTNEIFPGDNSHPSAPYGLGMRVPMIVVSPWSKGGWVNSQVFDHTSLIRFIEARFDTGSRGLLHETNITPWRRAVAGDLTSAFDFERPNSPRGIVFPGTAGFKPADFVGHPDLNVVPPANQVMPQQEPGVRRARALPYALHAHGGLQLSDGAFRIEFGNTGHATAVFHVRSGDAVHIPRSYTVEPHKSLADTWVLGSAPEFDLSVYGPNGFLRAFKGVASSLRSAQLDVRAEYDEKEYGITLVIANRSSQPAKVLVLDKYTGKSVELVIKPKDRLSKDWSLTRLFGWYDFVITVDAYADIEYHFAGHVETGDDSVTDPALGGIQTVQDLEKRNEEESFETASAN
jgi:phospholipase C